MALNEKTEDPVNVLTITRPTATRNPSNRSELLSTIEDVDSTHSLTPTQTTKENSLDRETSPFSPFYSHPTTRYSLEAQKTESKQNINVYDTDVEACRAPTKSSGHLLSKNNTRKEDCTVWPGQHTLKMRKRQMKQRKGCAWWTGLDNKKKIWAKILIALFLIGLVVGVGVGISKAVGGGIWSGNNTTKPIAR